MKEVDLGQVLPQIIEGFEEGAFLTVKHGDRVNTMTIGWGTIGRVWSKKVFTAMVRYSRFTHELIRKADSFTVSFPARGQLKEELAFCGTKSGRDFDKFQECGLKLQYIDDIESPILDEEGIHLVCKILYKQSMAPENLAEEVDSRWYADKDYHVIYYGEILKTFVK